MPTFRRLGILFGLHRPHEHSRVHPPRVRSRQAGTVAEETNENVRLASEKEIQRAESTRNSSAVTALFWVAVGFVFFAGDRLEASGTAK